MLQNMREKMQGIIAGAIVVLIAITFALWGVQYYLHGSHDTSTVAKVAGTTITQQAVQRAYSRAQQQELSVLGKNFAFDQHTQAQIKAKVIDQLIKDTILAKLADTLGLYIGRVQIQAGIMEMPVFQVNGGFSTVRFQQVLDSFFYSEQEFIQDMQRSLMLAQLDAGIAESAFILPFEEQNAARLLQERRDFGYFLITTQQFANNVSVTDAEITQYYNQHKDSYVTPEKVSVDYVELNSDAVKNKIAVNDAKLMQFYHDHAAQFNAAHAKMPLPFSSVKNKVSAAYIKQMAQQMLADMNDKLTDITYTNSDSLQPAATALGLSIKTSDIFKASGAKTGIAANSKIVKAAFSEEVLRQGYNSNPINISDNDIVVLRIKQHIPESVLPLDKVRDVIVKQLKQDKMKALAQQKAAAIMEGVRDKNASVTALATKYGVKWQKVMGAKRKGAVADNNSGGDSVLSAAFALPNPNYTPNVARVVDLEDKGYAVVQVLAVHDGGGDAKVQDKAQHGEQASLQRAESQYEYGLLVGEALKNAKVERYNNSNTDSQNGDGN